MVGPGQAVLDPVRRAYHVKAHRPGVDGGAVAGLIGDLIPVVGEDRADPAGHGFEHVLQELAGHAPVRRCNALGGGELGGPVDGHEHLELAFAGLHLGTVDVDRASVFATGPRPAGEGRWAGV